MPMKLVFALELFVGLAIFIAICMAKDKLQEKNCARS